MDAFCGIDVAFVKGKRLPLAVCVPEGRSLRALPLRTALQVQPPRGLGNVAALSATIVKEYAQSVAHYIDEIENHFGVTIRRIAIDAPEDFAPDGLQRSSERALISVGISCFPTPSRSQFESIRNKVVAHRASGGPENRLPHANQLWMLVGFGLFRELETKFDCIEVFPNAVIKTLDPHCAHKSDRVGFARQAELVKLNAGVSLEQVTDSSFGSRHDRLDAVISAWVAILEVPMRFGYGSEKGDTIWSIPRSARGASEQSGT